MELLRITSDSNSLRSFATTPICIVGSIASLIFSVVAWGDATVMSLIFGAMGIVLVGVSARMIGGLIAPFQWEFVIESEQLRFGRADQPRSQKVLPRSGIDCFIFDSGPDPSLCVHLGKAIAPDLAPGILQTVPQMEAVVATLQEEWPEVLILSREQFQLVCRQNRRTRRHS